MGKAVLVADGNLPFSSWRNPQSQQFFSALLLFLLTAQLLNALGSILLVKASLRKVAPEMNQNFYQEP